MSANICKFLKLPTLKCWEADYITMHDKEKAKGVTISWFFFLKKRREKNNE